MYAAPEELMEAMVSYACPRQFFSLQDMQNQYCPVGELAMQFFALHIKEHLQQLKVIL